MWKPPPLHIRATMCGYWRLARQVLYKGTGCDVVLQTNTEGQPTLVHDFSAECYACCPCPQLLHASIPRDLLLWQCRPWRPAGVAPSSSCSTCLALLPLSSRRSRHVRRPAGWRAALCYACAMLVQPRVEHSLQAAAFLKPLRPMPDCPLSACRGQQRTWHNYRRLRPGCHCSAAAQRAGPAAAARCAQANGSHGAGKGHMTAPLPLLHGSCVRLPVMLMD